jgi:hypothetical protein
VSPPYSGIEHGGIDYCNRLEDGKQCWLNVMCKSGFCADNAGGLQKGRCHTKNSAKSGETCYNGADEICQIGLECGKKDYWNQTCKHFSLELLDIL